MLLKETNFAINKKSLSLRLFNLSLLIISGCGGKSSPVPSPTPHPLGPICGAERWYIKTGVDPDALKVSLTNINKITIAQMINFPYPNKESLTDIARSEPYETNIYKIEATLVKYKEDTDKDYQLVLKDRAGNIMIAKIPDPSCVGKDSPFLENILNSRKDFDLKYRSSAAFKNVNSHVEITGVGFFGLNPDTSTGAKNAFEIHPITAINFLR